ncbi:MAG: 2-oxoacid:acceptor oxidoreductase subunit alpha [Deltaproteobacteria bacterium]|nr:MAG: 2-oxoacid:acceptor oxidoreductase subunit alpha [Deltaproteobacteria bacterium]
MDDLNVVIAGAAGEGVQTVGAALADTVSAQGYGVFSWQEFESRIRGGQNSYSIRISEEVRNAPLMDADILLALNEGAVKKYEPLLKQEGILLAEKEMRQRTIVIPFTKIAEKEFGGIIYANTIAVGALVATLGIELDTLNQILARQFADKGAGVVRANLAAAERGYSLADQGCIDMCPWGLPKRDMRSYLIGVNEAIPSAAAYAGCRYMSAYPMSPSTAIITFLAREEEHLEIFTEQAEDEIAAINMAIGASYGGARAMTATSGGGFALMVEGVSLAGMIEAPLVIVVAQRPGPATGLPTRTAQGDLLFAINSGHGEFPKMVLAPSDPKDAFHKTVRAFNLADKYQTVVIMLTDQFLSDSRFTVEDFALEEIGPTVYIADPQSIKDYKRYRLTADGISPRLYPGQSEHLVGVDSDEHNEEGHITEDLSKTAVAMVEKRLAKFEGLRNEVSPPEEVQMEGADIVLVGWGSSRQAILEGLELLNKEGIEGGMIHFTEVWPLPIYTFPRGKKYWTVESNATGQLARLLRSEYGLDFTGSIRRYDGLPLTGEYIRRRFNDYSGGV